MSDLPPALREIADHAGENIACAVAYKYGGTVWRVPVDSANPAAAELVALVGRAPVITLCLALRGESIAVPLARRAVVCWLARRGKRASEIADDLRISRRTARRYKREANL